MMRDEQSQYTSTPGPAQPEQPQWPDAAADPTQHDKDTREAALNERWASDLDADQLDRLAAHEAIEDHEVSAGEILRGELGDGI